MNHLPLPITTTPSTAKVRVGISLLSSKIPYTANKQQYAGAPIKLCQAQFDCHYRQMFGQLAIVKLHLPSPGLNVLYALPV